MQRQTFRSPHTLKKEDTVVPQPTYPRGNSHPRFEQDCNCLLTAATFSVATHRELVLKPLSQTLTNLGFALSREKQVNCLVEPEKLD
jgi:hypothetical protein